MVSKVTLFCLIAWSSSTTLSLSERERERERTRERERERERRRETMPLNQSIGYLKSDKMLWRANIKKS